MTKKTRPLDKSGEHEKDGSDKPGPVSTFLVIPYFAGDRGRPGTERPLPANVPAWLCSSIVVNGQPGGKFTRGEPTEVTVAVANWGAGTTAAPVQVSVWWVDPSTGFTTPTLFGQTVLSVPTGGAVYTSPPIVGVIPQTAPAHVCLLARVTSPMDVPEPGGAISPGIDRHWAQHNLSEVTVIAGQRFEHTFRIVNPLSRAMAFGIVARPVNAKALVHLAQTLGTKLSETRAMTMQVEAAAATRPVKVSSKVPKKPVSKRLAFKKPIERVSLKPGQSRQVQLVGLAPKDSKPGETFAVEVVQLGAGERDREQIVGSVGLLVTIKD